MQVLLLSRHNGVAVISVPDAFPSPPKAQKGAGKAEGE